MTSRAQLLKAAIACFLFAIVMAVIFFAVGCGMISTKPRTPAATVTTEGGTVLTQSGDAQVPASVSTKTATASTWLPAGSIVWQDQATGTLQYRLAKDSQLTNTVKTEQATAPQAFTPPAPPTPSDLADGKAVLWYRLGVAVGIAAAIFGLVRGWDWVMYGGGGVTAGCLFGLFVQTHPILLLVIGLCVAVAIAGPVLWHTKLKHLPIKSP